MCIRDRINAVYFHEKTEAQLKIVYLVYGNGLIKIKQTLYPSGSVQPELPRFGMKMTLPKSFVESTAHCLFSLLSVLSIKRSPEKLS